jgi:rhomboid protease GluP
LKWGGNLPALVFAGDWWRLITSVFLHAGIIHLVVNMYALYFIGSYMEPVLGKARYITAYVCAGIGASLTSAVWHNSDMIVSAGASGAIFGLFGVFLSLVTTGSLPRQIRMALLQGALIFVAYNIFYGLRPGSGVDNAAHLGGLASGMLTGYFYYFTFRRPAVNKTRLVIVLLCLALTATVLIVLHSRQTQPVEMDYKTGILFNRTEKQEEADTEKFSRIKEHFTILDELALEAIQPSDTLTREEFLTRLRKTALIDWTECINLMDESETLLLPAHSEKLRADLRQYSIQRVQETLLRIKANEEATNQYNHGIDSIQQLIDEIVKKINEENEPVREPEPRDL